MLANIPRDEFVRALKNIDGVLFLDSEVQIPTKHFVSTEI
jgi:hypothetical protein